ncbi:MAG TPA: ABC transporter permease [Candidatus Acidoferrum sp.]|jgi:putative ABC transport system permease protein
MHTFRKNLQFAFRMLLKSPGFTIVAVLMLALGIGANTAIFSILNSVLLRPLPYKDPSQLIIMMESSQRLKEISVPYPDFFDWRNQSHAFQQMAAAQNKGFNLAGIDQPERIAGYAASSNFLATLGVHPVMGRDFLPSEDQPGTAPVVLISHKLWQSHFAADPNVLGKTLTLNGRSFAIVGVLPPDFRFLESSDVIAPVGVWPQGLTERGSHDDLIVVGRLAASATLPQAGAEMDTIANRLAAQYPETNQGESISLIPIRDQFFGDTSQSVLILFGAVVFVLLIACVNVANLFLMRGAARSKEIAVRLAFGASRGQIVAQLLTESALLAVIGGALGLMIGVWGVTGLGHLIDMDTFAYLNIQVDRNVLLFTAAMVAFVALAFGLAPAWHASRPDVHETLKETSRGSSGGGAQHRLRSSLATAEMALALVLLVGAGLMVKSLVRLLEVNPGFQPDRVLSMEIDLRSAQYSTPQPVLNFWQQVLDRVRVLPGVEAVATGTVVPLTFDHSRADFTIDGQPLPAPADFPHPDFHNISPDYVSVMRIPLIRGREFTEADNETTPPVALVNQSMARRYWPHEDAVGKRILYGHPSDTNHSWITIVGIVGDTKLYGLANPSRFEVYLPFRQNYSNDVHLLVRSAADPTALANAIRGAVAAVDKDQPIFSVKTMRELVDDSVSTRRLTLILLALFSGLALILAAIGIYGVIAYSVEQRTREVGIRVAMGAQKTDVLRLVLAQGARLVTLGIIIGMVVAAALTRLMSTLLFGVTATDPATFAAVATLLAAVALAATYIPAHRATRTDPIQALRHE